MDSGVAQVAAGLTTPSSSRRMVRFGRWVSMDPGNSGMENFLQFQFHARSGRGFWGRQNRRRFKAIHSSLQNDGSLWAMGHNGYGQLGDGNGPTDQYPFKLQHL